MTSAKQFSLRRALRHGGDRISASFEGAASGAIDAVVAGRALLGVVGLAVVGFAPLLGPDRQGWVWLAAVSACMTAALAISYLVAWDRLSTRTTLVFPFLVCAALATLGQTSDGFAAPLTGVLTLCFAYLGLTQPPGTVVFGLPFAAVTLLSSYGVITPQVVVRLLIALFIWVLLAELLAQLTRRQRALNARLTGAAHRDELTGVSNRRGLHLRLAEAHPGDTLVMCDLDHFKQVNDTLGHAAGDRVLADFGALLRVGLREGDYCARFGGEEFLLLLPATTTAQARTLLERLRTQWTTLQPVTTFSGGVATCAAHRSVADTLAAADQMLYAAKAAGRDCTITELDRPALRAEALTAS